MTYRRGLHRFALLTAASTFLLIVAGGLVTSTGSGLAVPDWPTTYGRFMFAYPLDEMVGGIFYEHSHRMIASIVGMLTVVLAVWVWRRDERRWLRRLAAAALAAVIVQGVLGGITVLFLLPAPVSVAHATLAQTFFAAVAAIALATSRWWIEGSPAPTEGSDRTLRRMAGAAAAMVWIQLVAGAVMRHTGAGLAVPDVPLAWGAVLPSLDPQALDAYTREMIDRDLRIAADGPITAFQVVIHLTHRYWGMATGAVLLLTAVRLVRRNAAASLPRRLGLSLAALTVLQISLGVLTVTAGKPAGLSTAHVAGGALLLVAAVLAVLQCRRAGPPAAAEPAPHLRFGGASA